MQIGKDCEPYLRSSEVIEILQQSPSARFSKVFECLRKLKAFFFKSIVPSYHVTQISAVEDLKDDAFSKTEMIFFRHVQKNHFQPSSDYCTNYFYKILKTTYFEVYVKELRRLFNTRQYLQNSNLPFSITNQGEEDLLKDDYLALQVNKIVESLSEEDRKMFDMIYREFLKRNEIAALLNIAPEAVTQKKARFLKRFYVEWLNKNKI